MSKGSCDISSVLKHRNRVSFSAESLTESKAGNCDKAFALLMSSKWMRQLNVRTLLARLLHQLLTPRLSNNLLNRRNTFLSLPYLSMMSAMTQANICRPSGSCRATGESGKRQTEKLHTCVRVMAACYLIKSWTAQLYIACATGSECSTDSK